MEQNHADRTQELYQFLQIVAGCDGLQLYLCSATVPGSFRWSVWQCIDLPSLILRLISLQVLLPLDGSRIYHGSINVPQTRKGFKNSCRLMKSNSIGYFSTGVSMEPGTAFASYSDQRYLESKRNMIGIFV